MGRVIILGTSSALPDSQREHTHFVIQEGRRVVMVDCACNPVLRLHQAGISALDLTDLILTHFHPDHVSGAPLLLMEMWLIGRKTPLTVYGLADPLDRLEQVMDLYHWERWPEFYPLQLVRLPMQAACPVLKDDQLQISAWPVQHLIPTIGLRVEFQHGQRVLAYSCDTEPCAAVLHLAAGADVLLHESTGASEGHSSAAQAGEAARQAEVGRLLLIHYAGGQTEMQTLEKQARAAFGGQVEAAQDGQVLVLDALLTNPE
jgi:ribonuclease Z